MAPSVRQAVVLDVACWTPQTSRDHLLALTRGSLPAHRRDVFRLARHLVVLVLTLLVTAGNLAVCAGWQGTAAARMACCTSPGGCPMHTHGADDQTGSTASVPSQAQADGCCAASESDDATETPQGLAWSWAPALVVSLIVADAGPDVRRQLVRAPASHPPPARSVPRHLFLAVFLL